MRQNMVFSTKI